MVAEELPLGTNFISSYPNATYVYDNIVVWLFSSNSPEYFGGFFLDQVPDSIEYTVSDSLSGVKGKWALENTNQEGDILE